MAYIGNAPVVIPVERQVSGVNVGTIVAFPTDHPAPVGYVKSGEKFSKNTYPELFKYLNSETAPNIDNDQVGDIKWFSKRELLDGDYLPADGQLVDNGVKLYPDMWDAICNNEVPTVLEADFISDAHKRGSYTKGDNLSNFRVPDMNGKSLNTLGSVFIRGDGANSAQSGTIQGDAIRNIVGRSPTIGWHRWNEKSGVLWIDRGGQPANGPGDNDPGKAYQELAITIDASRTVPTAPENRPLNIAGCWAVRVKKSKTYYIKAAGFIENEGLAKIGGLVETDSRLQKQIDALNEKFHRCTLSHIGASDVTDTAIGSGSGVFKLRGTGDSIAVVDGSIDNPDFSITADENPIITIKKAGTYTLQYYSYGNPANPSVIADRRVQIMLNNTRFFVGGGKTDLNYNFSHTMQLAKGDILRTEVWNKLYYGGAGHNGYSFIRIR